MYSDINFKTKKELKQAVESGRQIGAFQPGGFFPSQTDGKAVIEGPQYPKPHRWYAEVILKNGIITSVK